MSKVFIDENNLTSIADNIRKLGNTTDKLSIPDGFNQAISNLAGTTEEDVISNLVNDYVNGGKVNG